MIFSCIFFSDAIFPMVLWRSLKIAFFTTVICILLGYPAAYIIAQMDEKKQVLIMRCLIVVFIVISVIIALVQYKSSVTFIAQLMGVSWGALAGAFLAPFLYGLYNKKATAAAVWVNFLFSTIFMIWNMLARETMPLILQSPINAGAFCMIIGLVIVPVVSLCTRKPDEAFVKDAFASYDKKVMVYQREALSDDAEEVE